jgi:hypothetical protein
MAYNCAVLAKTMKRLVVVSSVVFGPAIAPSNGLADSCFIQDQENTEFGVDKGITGQRSNNGIP